MKSINRNLVWIGAIFFIAIAIIAAPGIIRVKKITCESQFGPCRPDLQGSLNRYSGKSFRTATKAVVATLSQEPLVESFDVRFKLPAGIEVVVVEKKISFGLKDLKKNAIALVDKEGYIVAISDTTNLPTVSGVDLAGGVGEKVSARQLFALELISDMFTFYQVKDGTLQDDGLVVEIPKGPRVIFPLEGEKSVLFSSLRLIISKIEEEQGEKADLATIDLRYKNPVISY